MASCYVCNQLFNGTSVRDHGEHVIQNSLGGNLLATGILCETCGSNLGVSVDTDIFDALQAIAVLFDLRRDRGGSVEATTTITFKGRPQMRPPTAKFLFSHHGETRPTVPTMLLDHAAKSFHLFASSPKQSKAYRNSADFLQVMQSGYKEVVGTGPEDLADAITMELEPNSPGVLRGVLKVAIAYALHKGIAPANIRHFIVNDRDITRDGNLLNDTVKQYFPTGWLEALYEARRYETDDFPPNHQLVLFNEGTDLYCYVDLFGVIQKYVHLTDSYCGPPIVERYAQKCPKWVYTPSDWMVRRPKDLLLLAMEFDIPDSGKSLAQLEKEVKQKAASRPYDLPPRWQLAKLRDLILRLALLPANLWNSHVTTKEAHERAMVAESEFGSNYLSTLINNKLKILLFIQNLDPEIFRISGNKGSCPKGAAAIAPGRLEAYQRFRVDAFASRYGGARKVVIDTRF